MVLHFKPMTGGLNYTAQGLSQCILLASNIRALHFFFVCFLHSQIMSVATAPRQKCLLKRNNLAEMEWLILCSAASKIYSDSLCRYTYLCLLAFRWLGINCYTTVTGLPSERWRSKIPPRLILQGSRRRAYNLVICWAYYHRNVILQIWNLQF